jgi:molybdopterin-containing oxidoreductase family iron-sulfur binding subunit
MENQSKNGFTRRGFLKIIGASAAVGATACAPNKEEHIVSRVGSDSQQIPGSPVWYASTCTECSSGCGVVVKSVDGRVIKVEGNPLATINGHNIKGSKTEKRAGLCALGHSSLQNLYDPDRIREPLKRNPNLSAGGAKKFIPVSWGEALGEVATSLAQKNATNLLFTGELTGTISNLVRDWSSRSNLKVVAYDMMEPENLVRANDAVFGIRKLPELHFDRADVIVSIGCDFLETWISPVEYASDWAKRRDEKKPGVFFQIEPRLSMTGAKSDRWLNCQPGSELVLARFILKKLLMQRKEVQLDAVFVEKLSELVKDSTIDEVESVSGISRDKILSLIEALLAARKSLVVAGFEGEATSIGYKLQVVVQLINLVLGNVAQDASEDETATITFSRVRDVTTSFQSMQEALKSLEAGNINVAMVYGTDPVFALPSTIGLVESLGKAKLVVAFASHFNDTVEQADIILPVHTSFEDWGDVMPQTGSYGLLQPAMTPIFNTRSFGNLILLLSDKTGVPLYKEVAGQNKYDFYEYLKESWRVLANEKGWLTGLPDFDSFWKKAIEDGGIFTDEKTNIKPGEINRTVVFAALNNDSQKARFSHRGFGSENLLLLPFVHLKGHDGRAANRAWLQELPDPISQVVWDSWGEINTKTAQSLNLNHGDPLTVRTFYGEINVPLRVTDYIAPGIVSVPIGQGHTSYGRYAQAVKNGNVLDLLPVVDVENNSGLSYATTRVEILKARGVHPLVSVQGSDSQHGRELAKTRHVSASLLASEAHGHHNVHNGSHVGDNHHGSHQPKQMYEQRVHPLYEWGMTIDLAACTGCSSCIVACYAENNIPVVGKKMVEKGREMAWLRIERYFDVPQDNSDEVQVSFLPMMCQHCHNAPCEPVCPVYATYHNEEGMNVMVYNRCVGTRYCSNNCSYKVRRFNWVDFDYPEPLNWQLNPQVTKRSMGVMEKCTFCVQRIADAKDLAKDEGRMVQDGDVSPACVQTCPTEALVFGNLKDPDSRVSKLQRSERAYKVLDHHLNTQPAVSYLENIKFNA